MIKQIKQFLSKIFPSPMDKWTIGQKLAWGRYCEGALQWKDNMNKACFTSQGDYEALIHMMYEKQQEQEYVFWFINNNPHLIEDDGRIMPQINKGKGLQREFQEKK